MRAIMRPVFVCVSSPIYYEKVSTRVFEIIWEIDFSATRTFFNNDWVRLGSASRVTDAGIPTVDGNYKNNAK